MVRVYKLKELQDMPTLLDGEFEQLKVVEDQRRVWLRKSDNMVIVEQWVNYVWAVAYEYPAENTTP